MASSGDPDFSPDRVPLLYRQVLDALDELERRGFHRDVVGLRREAIDAYGRGFDLHAWQRLREIHERAGDLRAMASVPEPQGRLGAGS